MSSYTHIPRIYICSPYTAVASRREARRIAIRALEEADEFFDGKGLAVELFSPVLANSVQYADRSYDEIMKICFMQIDTCGEIFIPSAKTCDLSLIAGSKGIGLEIEYATARGYKIHNDEALRREKFYQNLKGESDNEAIRYRNNSGGHQEQLTKSCEQHVGARNAFRRGVAAGVADGTVCADVRSVAQAQKNSREVIEAKRMNYKTKLQALDKELKDIKKQKEQAENEFFKTAAEQIRDDFPFSSSHRNFLDNRGFFFSANGKFKCSKTMTYDNLFLGDVTFRFYHEKRQAEKVKKAEQIIEKLYEGGNDERD